MSGSKFHILLGILALGCVIVLLTSILRPPQRTSSVTDPAAVAEAKAAAGWGENFAQATARAQQERKLLLVYFTGSDWCVPCKMLDEEVLSKPEFLAYAKEKLVLMAADFPLTHPLPADVVAQNEDLQAKYAVAGYPTLLVLDPQGRELGKWLGLPEGGGAPALIAKLDALRK